MQAEFDSATTQSRPLLALLARESDADVQRRASDFPKPTPSARPKVDSLTEIVPKKLPKSTKNTEKRELTRLQPRNFRCCRASFSRRTLLLCFALLCFALRCIDPIATTAPIVLELRNRPLEEGRIRQTAFTLSLLSNGVGKS